MRRAHRHSAATRLRGLPLLLALFGCDDGAATVDPAPDAPAARDGGPRDAAREEDFAVDDFAVDDFAVPDAAAGEDFAVPDAGCPPWQPPPGLGGVSHATVDEATAQRWLDFRAEREQARMLAEVDPERARARLRVSQSAIDRGCVETNDLIDLGRALFMREVTPADGLNGPFNRLQGRGRADAFRCVNCRWKGGFAGAGDRADNAFFFGDGDDLASSDVRNPPALWGAGWTQRVAAEMSAELRAAATAAEPGSTVALSAKGVGFGRLTVGEDGSWDTSAVRGVDADLVVRPFGWKGTFRTLREFAATSLHGHFGVQSATLLRAPDGADLGAGPPDDPDEDGVRDELTEGQMTALVAFLATLDGPQVAVPVEGDASAPLTPDAEFVTSPEFVFRWLEGSNLFDALGCSGCHVPFMRVDDPTWRTDHGAGAFSLDLGAEAARPRPTRAEGAWLVPVFSDFKRHAMGEWLAGRHTERGVPADQYMTRRLWGLAGTPPYLHDGSATTLDEAIFMHGGPGSEAAFAAHAYAELREGEKAALRVFLVSLRRAPSIRVR